MDHERAWGISYIVSSSPSSLGSGRPVSERAIDRSFIEVIVCAYPFGRRWRRGSLGQGGTEMPLISTIIAGSLALHDWYLSPWVDVSATNTGTSCYAAYQGDANVNTCDQTCFTLLADTREELMSLVPALLSGSVRPASARRRWPLFNPQKPRSFPNMS